MWEITALTLAIEIICIVGRLFFGSAKRWYGKRNIIRVHHGYIGLALILINIYLQDYYLFILGMSLFLSDAIHHFIVLPIWIKKTEFP